MYSLVSSKSKTKGLYKKDIRSPAPGWKMMMRYVHEDDDDDNDDYIQILVIIEKAGEVVEYVFIIACKLAALN